VTAATAGPVAAAFTQGLAALMRVVDRRNDRTASTAVCLYVFFFVFVFFFFFFFFFGFPADIAVSPRRLLVFSEARERAEDKYRVL
jgi:hypothetical protein